MPNDELILVVEDDAAVRSVIERGLAAYGFRTLTAGDGFLAELLMAEHGDDVALIVSDVLLPGLNGPELIGRLRKSRPGLPTIFISGFTGDHVMGHGSDVGRNEFLGKPFTPAELADKIREILSYG
jgi:two-component system cell cycle sensor histidine kinase/response regulator CckA